MPTGHRPTSRVPVQQLALPTGPGEPIVESHLRMPSERHFGAQALALYLGTFWVTEEGRPSGGLVYAAEATPAAA